LAALQQEKGATAGLARATKALFADKQPRTLQRNTAGRSNADRRFSADSGSISGFICAEGRGFCVHQGFAKTALQHRRGTTAGFSRPTKGPVLGLQFTRSRQRQQKVNKFHAGCSSIASLIRTTGTGFCCAARHLSTLEARLSRSAKAASHKKSKHRISVISTPSADSFARRSTSIQQEGPISQFAHVANSAIACPADNHSAAAFFASMEASVHENARGMHHHLSVYLAFRIALLAQLLRLLERCAE